MLQGEPHWGRTPKPRIRNAKKNNRRPPPQAVSRRRRRRTPGTRPRVIAPKRRAKTKIVFPVKAPNKRHIAVKLWRTGRCVRLGALTGACTAKRHAAAVRDAFICATVKPAVSGRFLEAATNVAGGLFAQNNRRLESKLNRANEPAGNRVLIPRRNIPIEIRQRGKDDNFELILSVA